MSAAAIRTLLMLGNRAALWECMLALIKLGAVIIPSATLLTPADLRRPGGAWQRRARDRGVRHRLVFAGVAGDYTRVAVGEIASMGWLHYDDFVSSAGDFTPDGPTPASDPLFLYFTSGTTARPKLVEHTHASYPIGHLSTMYWIALQPGDVHLNLAGAGWAKHAWSNIFAPWNAEATVLILNTARFSATAAARHADTLLGDQLLRAADGVADADPGRPAAPGSRALREALSAGEPLNPEVIEQVRARHGVSPSATDTDRRKPQRRWRTRQGSP